jgi:hypothetical protein
MTTPNPALVAAAPVLEAVIDEMTTFINTVLTGDPLQIPLRLSGATDIFVGQVKLQFPQLVSAEVGVVQTEITGALGGLKSKLQALTVAAASAAKPS